jgi:glycosyltransferase involved in cell wall biosynthesis
MKILISAFACEPGKGSEPGVGWNMVTQIARDHDVWVLTQNKGREAIEKALVKEPLLRARFIYVDILPATRFWLIGSGVQIRYYLWQIKAYFAARKLQKTISFDLIHHVTLARYWTPSFLALLRPPFIWGPVGGGESAPPAFRKTFGARGRLFETLRDLARKAGETDPFLRLTARKALIGLATTEQTAGRMRKLGCKNVSVMSESALSRREIDLLSTLGMSDGKCFRIVSIGRMLHWKGFHLGLQAFAEIQQRFPQSEYCLIGDGPERMRLQEIAKDLKLHDSVVFRGNVPRAEVLEQLERCDVLLHPSLHDAGGWVCLEAMASGRPVVCLDLGGPSVQVTPETGFKVMATTPDATVKELAEALLRLAESPMLRSQMGWAARERIRRHFEWEGKAAVLTKLYDIAAFQSGEGTSTASTTYKDQISSI